MKMMPQLKIPILMQSKNYIYKRTFQKFIPTMWDQCQNGGMTKGFTSLDELATHLYGKYGKNWQKYVRTVSPSRRMTKHKGVKPDIAPDIHGIFPTYNW